MVLNPFFPGTPVFHLSKKIQHFLIGRQEPLCTYATTKIIFIILQII